MSEDDKKIIIKADMGCFGVAQGREKSMRVLVFALGDEKYCVDIKVAREAVGMRRVTKVPNTPSFVLGVMNLRGEIVSLIDISYFLGLSGHARGKNPWVIVCDIKGMTVGLVVDSIYKALNIDPEIIQPTLATVKGRLAEYTRGQADTEEGILIFLDLSKLLGSEEIERLKGGK